MTVGEFIAVCFWPTIGLAVFAMWKARNTAVFGLVVNIVSAPLIACVVLAAIYDKSSIIAVNDAHVGLVLMGLILAGSQLRQPPLHGSWRDKAKPFGSMILIVLIGSGIAWYAGRMLFLDHLTSRLVIEGRVDRVWRSAGRRADYLVGIAGRSVKVTQPLYEHLGKFKPMIRVEVGRGSNYVYDIEYLAN